MDNLYTMSNNETTTSETLSFRDGSAQWMSSIAGSYDATRDVTYKGDVSLGDFFARPVKTHSFTWGTADVTPFFQSIDPWTTYLSNPRVSNRISNYANFSGKLHVKFVINGNSFFYGRLMADYAPWYSYDAYGAYGGTTLFPLTQASQRLHLYLDPCESQGGELELPFVWWADKVNLTQSEYNALGQLFIRQMQPLKHANGATATVNITIFMWMTEVKLSMPTTQDIPTITAQGGAYDEYGSGPVSDMATAAARAAGSLSTVPIIGKYAKATSMVAGAIGGMAKAFGFSKPALIDDYVNMRPSFISRLATCSGGDNVSKLTVDPKQELSIDPGIVGMGNEDELAIESIVTKESYLTQFGWNVAYSAGTLLFAARVGPTWVYNSLNYYLPAMMFASLPFKHWKGSIVYRFQIVASGYHKGRLLIVWDPVGTGAGGPETNVQYSKIVDLSEERDFTFEIGYGSSTGWLLVPTLSTTAPFRTSAAYNNITGTYNGSIAVYVLNELTTPSSTATSDIAINVFVAGCKDYRLAVPTGDQIASLTNTVSITPQAGAFEEVATENKNAPQNPDAKETIAHCIDVDDSTDLVYFGESVTSFRTLLKRYNFWSSLYAAMGATAGVIKLSFPSYPGPRGYSAYGAVLKTANYYNPCNTTLMTYLGYAYVGFRGGVRWKILQGGTFAGDSAVSVITRLPSSTIPANTPWVQPVADVVTTPLAYSVNRVNTSFANAQAGAHATLSKLQAALEIEAPFYRNYRFLSPRYLNSLIAQSASIDTLQVSSTCSANGIINYEMYVAAAEDFSLVGFQGCPPLQIFAIS